MEKIRRCILKLRNIRKSNSEVFENPLFDLSKEIQQSARLENPLLSINVEEINKPSNYKKKTRFADNDENAPKHKVQQIARVRRTRFKGHFNNDIHDGQDEKGPFIEHQMSIDLSELSDKEISRISELGIINPKKADFTLIPHSPIIKCDKRFNCGKDRYEKPDSLIKIEDYVLNSRDAATGALKVDLLRAAAANKKKSRQTDFEKATGKIISTGQKRVINIEFINEKHRKLNP